MNRQNLFNQFLESRNLRNTAGRRAILQEIFDLGERHFSAEDLVGRLRGRGEPVSRATVYRTLDHLVAGGLVRRLSLGPKHALYEGSLGGRHHEHLICLHCGAVTEFGSGTLERLLERVCRRRRFAAQRRSIQIFGMCARCAEGGRAKRG